MQQKIIDILIENTTITYENNDGTAVDCLEAVNYYGVSKEITAHVFEFIEWCMKNTFWHYQTGYGIIDVEIDGMTIEQLYEYWSTKVKQ